MNIKITSIIVVIYTLLLSALGAVALYLQKRYYLPFPSPIAILTTVLPFVDLIALRQAILGKRSNGGRKKGKSTFAGKAQKYTILGIVITTIIQTLLSGYTLPYLTSSTITSCSLRSRWEFFYHNKESKAIGSIQDDMSCCGYANMVDMPFPFPGGKKPNTILPEACKTITKRTASCSKGWKEKMQVVGWLVFVGNIVSVVTKVVLAFIAMRFQELFERLIGGRDSTDGYQQVNGRRLIEPAEDEDDDNVNGQDNDEVRRDERVAATTTPLLLPQENGVKYTDNTADEWSRA